MPELAVDFCGFELRNPFVAASSPATETVSGIVRCGQAGAGAIITKSIADYDEDKLSRGARRTYVGSRGLWATSTFRRETITRQAGTQLLARASRQSVAPIIASVTAMDLDPDSWLGTCLDLQSAGASMIQLDLFYLPQPVCTDSSIKALVSLIHTLTTAVSIPILPKLNLELPAYLMASCLSETDIAGVSLLDSVRVPSPVKPDGSSAYSSVRQLGMSSLFGAWQLPLTQHYTMILSRLTNFPLCVGGGLTSSSDALEMIMLGATTVQYATTILTRGYEFLSEALKQLDNLLQELGHHSVRDARGIASQRQYTDVEGATPRFEEAMARVDHEKCTMCRKCLQLTFCTAIAEDGGRIDINSSCCDGCGFCAYFCDSDAIRLENLSSHST